MLTFAQKLGRNSKLGSLDEGARNAVGVCMAVRPGEHVLVVTDRNRLEVGEALQRAAERITPGNTRLEILENYGERPLTYLPDGLSERVPWANVTFYAAEAKPGELGLRGPFIRLAIKHARHGHMPGIRRDLMEDGMCADYVEVARMTRLVHGLVTEAKTAHVTTSRGTDLHVEFDPNWKWVPSDGMYHEQGKWGNLPEGEVFTAARKANGRMVLEELGDWFDEKYGILTESPITLEVKDSRVDLGSVRCSRADVRDDLVKYLQTDENSNRLGEFAIGTNTHLTRLIGKLLQDEKFPGVHCAFGDPYPEETGADWESKTHVDGIMTGTTIVIDDRKLMENGRFLV
jgi:leucyl aminopeptidase (aminopeptidase T)